MNHSDWNLVKVFLLNLGRWSVPFMTSQEVNCILCIFLGFQDVSTSCLVWRFSLLLHSKPEQCVHIFFFLLGFLQTFWRPSWRWHCNTDRQSVVRHMRGRETSKLIRVLTSSATVKSLLPSSSSSVDQTNCAFVIFQYRTDTCQCVWPRHIYPKRYSPGAVSGQSRFAGLFRLIAGWRAVLRRAVNSFKWFKAFSVCP